MIYRATYRDRVPVLAIMLALAAFFVSVGVIIHSLFLVAIGNSIVLFFVLIKLRLRLETSDEGLVYVNLLGRWEGKWDEIRRMKRLVTMGIPLIAATHIGHTNLSWFQGKRKSSVSFSCPIRHLKK